jgi:hypothetical protein
MIAEEFNKSGVDDLDLIQCPIYIAANNVPSSMHWSMVKDMLRLEAGTIITVKSKNRSVTSSLRKFSTRQVPTLLHRFVYLHLQNTQHKRP